MIRHRGSKQTVVAVAVAAVCVLGACSATGATNTGATNSDATITDNAANATGTSKDADAGEDAGSREDTGA